MGQNGAYLKDVFRQWNWGYFEATLEAATGARNEIVHEVARDLNDSRDNECDERVKTIGRLIRPIAKADELLSAMLHILNGDPLPVKEFLETYVDRVEAWVVENTFGEDLDV